MEKIFTPILVIPAVPHEDGIRFLHRNDQIDLGPNMAETVWKILEHCNGYNSIQIIAEKSGVPKDEVEEILMTLEELEIIMDSREQYLHFHKIRNYPTGFYHNLTQDEVKAYTASPRAIVKTGETFMFTHDYNSFFFDVQKQRRSCRSFSTKKLTRKQIGNICHYAYSIKDHAVPSGGALYPLKIFVILTQSQIDLTKGYYEYNAENDILVLYNKEVDEEQLKYCFNQEKIPFHSQVQIVIAADLSRQPYKYSNRGYMLTLIEVGHVAENISLYCAEQGLGSCELGGILDEPMKQELELDENIYPILAIPVGYPATKAFKTTGKTQYIEEMVGEDKLVKKVWATSFDENGSFFGATAMYLDAMGNEQYAGATSPAYNDAVFKAVIEGYERCLSGKARVDYHGKASELDRWIHPYDHFPLTREQAKKCGVEYFTMDLPIDWTLGVKYDGTEVYVPTDIVYYGQKPHENRIYYGHSSGVAAYSNVGEAKKRALTELIERDAIMRNWYAHESPNIIADIVLPVHARKRIKHWEKNGRKMTILQLPSKYGMVFEITITSHEYPCFVCGAAATLNPNAISETINKALQEAEYNLLLAINSTDRSEIAPRDVNTPAEHGRLYYHEKYAKALSWLTEGHVVHGYRSFYKMSFSALEKELNAHYVDFSNPESDLRIVRALSPKLAQINFGFYSAHFDRLDLKIYKKSLEMPHYFA